MSPSLLDFLRHILNESSFVVTATRNKEKEAVINDPVLSRAIVRALEVIGEATKKLPEDFRKTYPQIDWDEMAGMRDMLIHHYWGVDYEIFWQAVSSDIPALADEIRRIIETETNK